MTLEALEALRVTTMLEGVILSYRLGRRAQYPKECLIRILGVEPAATGMMLGWRVAWPADEPKIQGRIVGRHGRRGTLRARFRRSLPGQALGSRVKVYFSSYPE